MSNWQVALGADPLPWLLDAADPAVRHLALRWLLDAPADDRDVRLAREAALAASPIANILAAQHPDGYWVKPGAGYAPKYTGTVWQVVFLDQLGADAADPRVRAAGEYVLAHSQSEAGGFGASGGLGRPAPSAALHCLNGNLLRALLGLGWSDEPLDPRVERSLAWQVSSITGEGHERYYRSGTSGPGFACAANGGLPCAWGAIKAALALARVPAARRTPPVQQAIEQTTAFLLSRDPAVADYPAGPRDDRPSAAWQRLGFPLGYVADTLQALEALAELGCARDPRLHPAVDWLLAKRDRSGRWRNQHSYAGKTWVDVDEPRQPSKWVTLRACRVLRATLG